MGYDGAIAKARQDRLTIQTAGGARVIQIEVAETEDDKAMGLMYRTSVPENTGMLFPYSAPREITMWMKNTYVSLDMVFINAEGVVSHIAARTEPLSEAIIPSRGPALAVLELAAGAAERLGIKPGDKVDYALFAKGKR